MPTISSGGTMPPPLERRISERTPGAILQPQPPPCEKLVRRSGSGSSGAAAEVFAFMGVRSGHVEPCSIVSAPIASRRQQIGHERPHRRALESGPKARL